MKRRHDVDSLPEGSSAREKQQACECVQRIADSLVTPTVKVILHIICRIYARELDKLPRRGPYIIVVNHVNFLEAPILYVFLRPRRIFTLVKVESWNNPFLRFLAWIWDAIPIKRGTADFSALRKARAVLDAGNILVIAPEGTRTGDGRLRRGNPGAILLAAHSRVPVYPVVHTGGHRFYRQIKRLRRTLFSVSVGEPFIVDLPRGTALRNSHRREITDEMMARIASLLPPALRGIYENSVDRPARYLRTIDPGPHPSRSASAIEARS